MAKIFITGASGTVGSWLVKEALEQGLETYAGIRSTSNRDLLQDDRIHIIEIDFEDESELRQILSKHQFDIIVQNAGITRAPKDSEYFKVNSDYSVLLANSAAEEIGPKLKKFIFISSIEAFGSADNTPDQVVDNTITPRPRTTYGKSKLRAEGLLKEIKNLPLIIMRPTAVFGPAEKDIFQIWQTIKTFRFAPVIGNKDIKYSFIYVKDLVRVIIAAALSDIVNRHYFVSDGRIHKIQDFTQHVASSLGVQPFRCTIPYFVLEFVISIAKIKDKLVGTKSLLNDEQLAKMKAQNWDCDIADLVKDFDFQARYTLKDAIYETTQWYITNKWL